MQKHGPGAYVLRRESISGQVRVDLKNHANRVGATQITATAFESSLDAREDKAGHRLRVTAGGRS